MGAWGVRARPLLSSLDEPLSHAEIDDVMLRELSTLPLGSCHRLGRFWNARIGLEPLQGRNIPQVRRN